MSRPKRMLPVLGQPPKPEAPRDAPSEDAAACCTPGEADACCGSATRLGVAGLRTREADSEMLEGDLARSIVRVEGMDCASCAAIVVNASALLFALGLALGFLGAPDAARVGAYATAIVVGGLPIFRAALAGVRTKHLDMNV